MAKALAEVQCQRLKLQCPCSVNYPYWRACLYSFYSPFCSAVSVYGRHFFARLSKQWAEKSEDGVWTLLCFSSIINSFDFPPFLSSRWLVSIDWQKLLVIFSKLSGQKQEKTFSFFFLLQLWTLLKSIGGTLTDLEVLLTQIIRISKS